MLSRPTWLSRRQNRSFCVQEEKMEIGFIGMALILGLVLIWFWNSIYIIKEWERGVVLRLGRLLPEAKSAGLNLVLWPIETLYRINMRIETLDVPPQDIITRDNVSKVEVKQVDIPEQMQRAIARQAEAERERRAKIIHAEGESEASQKLADAARVLETQPSAIQLRYLQTLTEIGVEKNTTIVFPLPIDIINQWTRNLGGQQR